MSTVNRSSLFVILAALVVAVVSAFLLIGDQKPANSIPSEFATADLRPEIKALESRALSGALKAKLGTLYVKQAKLTGDVSWYDKAEAVAQESLAGTQNVRAKLVLAETWEKRHLFDKSMAMAKAVLKELPNDPEALATYAAICLAVGELDEATRATEIAVKLLPETPVLLLRAQVLNARGRDLEAEFYFRKALEVESRSAATDAVQVRTVYGRFLMNKGRYDEAQAYADEALRIKPGQYQALALLGDLHFKRNDPERAAKAFIDSFSASPQVSSLRKYARAKKLLKDDRGAEDGMREALALARKEIASGVHAHPLELSYVLVAGNEPAGWQEAIQLATDELKVRRSVLPYNALASALEKAGHLEAAAAAIDTVLRTGVRNPDYYMLAAKIARRMGDGDRARLYYSAALAEDSNLSDAKSAIEALKHQVAAKPVAQNKE